MPKKRALVECVVLALQDSCVFYPCCKGCFSRIDTDSQSARLTCSKCGCSCARSLLEHRYRLSLRVARGSCVFGVTVFGNCLNQFFGTGASGLQRLVADQSETLESSKSALLVNAVKECFNGKHFIFGIKVTESDHEPWVEHSSGSGHMPQFIATQMMLPKAAGLRGCTVLNYYKTGLLKATQTQKCIADANRAINPKEESQWMVPPNSPTPGFTNDTLQSSGFALRFLSRSQHLDSSLSPTPPWQQTLGLITSSAEQEEHRKDDNNGPCFSEKCRRSTTPLKSWLGLPPPAHKTAGFLALQVNELCASGVAESILNSPALDEFPLSESLTEFVKEKNELHLLQQNKLLLESVHDGVDMRKNAENKEPTEASEEEHLENSIYNCSADLFSNSLSNAALLPASIGHSRGDVVHKSIVDSSLLTSKVPLSEIEHLEKPAKSNLRDSFQLPANFDFVPPSQSTPAENITLQKGKFLRSNLKIRHRGESTKENLIHSSHITLHSCVTPKSRFSNPDKIQHGFLKKKNFSARRGVLNSTVSKRRASGFGDEDNALIVPPTPVNYHKTSLFKHCNEQSFNVTSENNIFQTESKSDCKFSESCLAVDESECINTDEECDWSKDLFSV